MAAKTGEHQMLRWVTMLCVFASVLAIGAPQASEEILIIEQNYKIVEHGDKGVQGKDVRQILYVTPEFICIDEFGGKAGDKASESIMVDLKNKQIINLDHVNKKKVVESFEDRRKRIETRKATIEKDIADQPDGPQKERMVKLYRSFLDDRRKFAFDKDAGEAKTLSGVECKPIKVIDTDKPDYAPFSAQLHTQLEMPYDNTEVLYLLQLIGKKMADFLRVHRETFKYVPMELHVDLAAGGQLDTSVVSVKKVRRDKLDEGARGKLGSPFVVPEDYELVQKKVKPPVKKDKEDAPN
jgi:hypothetical protein